MTPITLAFLYELNIEELKSRAVPDLGYSLQSFCFLFPKSKGIMLLAFDFLINLLTLSLNCSYPVQHQTIS